MSSPRNGYYVDTQHWSGQEGERLGPYGLLHMIVVAFLVSIGAYKQGHHVRDIRREDDVW